MALRLLWVKEKPPGGCLDRLLPETVLKRLPRRSSP
ncbi:hypothetical protein PFWH6_5535 [Pseudomonas fluorescens WH6]|nr:hypothetical protein PFWH6_5535 [Pseudomonas fluorescens WH6]